MGHRYLTQSDRAEGDLFGQEAGSESRLRFGEPPQVALETRVPEDVWGTPKKKPEEPDNQERLAV